MEPVVCIDCGNPIGMYYEAFKYMREVLLTGKNEEIHIDLQSIDPQLNTNLVVIFESLHIENYCCRSQLTSCLSMRDLE